MLLIDVQILPLLAVYLTAVTTFGVLLYRYVRKKNATHRAEIEVWARELGFSYREKDEFGLAAQLRDFDLFRSGNKNGIRHLLSGEIKGVQVHLFEYAYMVYTGKSAVEVRQTVFFAQNKNWYLPAFKVKPETWWHKVLDHIGAGKDINFPENPEFSGKFWLTGEFESQIRQVFGYDLQRFLTERPPVHVEGNNYFLVAYKPGKTLNKDEAEVFLSNCARLVELFKDKGEKFELLDLAELKKDMQQEIKEPLKNEEKL